MNSKAFQYRKMPILMNWQNLAIFKCNRWQSSFLFAFLLSHLSCSQNETSNLVVEVIQEVVPRTIIANEYHNNISEAINPRSLRIPSDLLEVFTIVRSHAELRYGPGTQFSLMPDLLPEKTKVIALESTGIWRKVLALDSHNIGWVHFKVMKKNTETSSSFIIPINLLPKVFTTTDRATAFNFESMKPFELKTTKGTYFIALKRYQNKVLTLIEPTNSVVWIAKKDII